VYLENVFSILVLHFNINMVNVRVNFTLEQATKAQRWSRGIALTLDGGGWSVPRPSHFTPGKDPVPIVQEAGWAPGPVWTGEENHIPTGI
jgi:hypothetical protein